MAELQARQDAFLSSLPEKLADYIHNEVEQPRLAADPIEAEWRKARTKLREWSQIRYSLLTLHPTWQKLVDALSYYSTTDPQTARAIQQSSQYKAYQTALTNARKQIRLADAELEAMLIKWGYLSSAINPMTASYFQAGSTPAERQLAAKLGIPLAR